MLLTVNIGNKIISFAVFDGDGEVKCKFSLSADREKTVDEYALAVKSMLEYKNIDLARIDGAVEASVVPSLSDRLKKAVEMLISKDVLVVGPGVKTGFAIRIDDPAELGADLVANAAAIVAEMKREGSCEPALILDMGTVTTLFAINKNREVTGGVIMPGVGISLDALNRETALLPNVALEPTARAIGKNTRESLCSGVIYGQAAMIDGLCDRFERELKIGHGEARLFATGEYCESVIANCGHEFKLDADLTAKGLYAIYKNTKI